MTDWKKTKCGTCVYQRKKPICNSCLSFQLYRPMTNADRIRTMTDEELHNFIRAIRCCTRYGEDCGYPFCHSMKGNLCNGIKDNKNEELLEWLQSEAE